MSRVPLDKESNVRIVQATLMYLGDVRAQVTATVTRADDALSLVVGFRVPQLAQPMDHFDQPRGSGCVEPRIELMKEDRQVPISLVSLRDQEPIQLLLVGGLDE
jgi:hypothetical protein